MMDRSMRLLGLVLASTFAIALSAQAEGDDGKEIGWSGEVNLSISSGTGTTNTFAGNLDAKAVRTWEKDLVSARFTGALGTTEKKGQREETTQNSQGVFGDWKRTISERFFWDTGTEASRDNIQDRELRARLKTGPGYRVWQEAGDEKQHFDVSAGFGYRYEIYDGNTGAGVDENGDTDHFADAVAGFEYKHLLFDGKVDYTHTANVALPVNDPNAFLVETEVIAKVPLSDAWSFRVGVLVQYTNDVPAEIEKLSTRTTVGLGYTF